jgi:hypothetical protein
LDVAGSVSVISDDSCDSFLSDSSGIQSGSSPTTKKTGKTIENMTVFFASLVQVNLGFISKTISFILYPILLSEIVIVSL